MYSNSMSDGTRAGAGHVACNALHEAVQLYLMRSHLDISLFVSSFNICLLTSQHHNQPEHPPISRQQPVYSKPFQNTLTTNKPK